MCTLQIPPGAGADDAGDQGGGYEGEETPLTSQIHVEVQPQQQVPVSSPHELEHISDLRFIISSICLCICI